MRFVIRDPKKGRAGSAHTATARCGTLTQYVAALSAVYGPICCVLHLIRDAARSRRNRRSGKIMNVVHFRKTVNTKKIGSPRNALPVI